MWVWYGGALTDSTSHSAVHLNEEVVVKVNHLGRDAAGDIRVEVVEGAFTSATLPTLQLLVLLGQQG